MTMFLGAFGRGKDQDQIQGKHQTTRKVMLTNKWGRQGGDQGEKLKYKSDRSAPHVGALISVEVADILIADHHFAGRRKI